MEQRQETVHIHFQRLDAGGVEVSRLRDTQTAKAAGIDKAQLSTRRQSKDGVSVLHHFGLRLTNLQAPGHAEVNDPLGSCAEILIRQVEDDMFSHSSHGSDAAVFQRRGDRRGGRFQRFFFLAEPDGFDNLARDPFGQSARDGFDFGEFGHG